MVFLRRTSDERTTTELSILRATLFYPLQQSGDDPSFLRYEPPCLARVATTVCLQLAPDLE